ncbi:MAG: methylase involved in ubiquinone/menaquinone biosynthesis [Alphaproteobacteria bacterium]|jgi:ubiquinone/menaquinone biosynthesis C-methylase UbiE|nr:methylase involved in ubiquinone/menaquinone biosynthesis [Alphaproteobacteria bacterium]
MKKVILHKQKLIDLLSLGDNNFILDYGCGRGDFIELLLEQNHQPKQIWAVDSNPDMVRKIHEDFEEAIREGKVVSQVVSTPIDLIGQKFDKIICQNVLECIEDKINFINAFKDLLNPGGVFILSHHDFDSAIYHSDLKKLTRDLVHHFSDTQQPWQQNADGQMGRKIPGLIAQSKFAHQATCETWRLVERNFTPGTYGFLMAQMVMEIGKGTFDNAEMQKWVADLEEKNNAGDYYFAIDLGVGKIIQ